MIAFPPYLRLMTASMIFLLGAACGGDTSLVDPDNDDEENGSGGGGGVQRATLELRLVFDPADAEVIEALGLSGGPAGMEVLIRRAEDEFTATSDAQGRVTFPDLLPGIYTASAFRQLTDAEKAALPEAHADVTGLGGGDRISVTAPTAERQMEIAAGRRGSLVFSELFPATPRLPSGDWYWFGQFWEIYNNSDTIIDLTGKIMAIGFSQVRDYNEYPCQDTERWRNDPQGIWTRSRYAFPGGSIAPGQVVVIAMDAIDHRSFVSGLPDLSNADFEFIGSQDADNPAVPNMIQMSSFEERYIPGHGPYVGVTDALWVLAEAASEQDLELDTSWPYTFQAPRRIPPELILDVFTTAMRPSREASISVPLCPELVHSSFDRQHGYLLDVSRTDPITIRRKSLGATSEGRLILQRTRTSERDFEQHAPQTAGSVP